ncbi:MAG: hypothetical protein EXS05_19950 [Planctomycetaceae bacterium]|nr:hypothetical protein [Planctomycetaceae bacterium]
MKHRRLFAALGVWLAMPLCVFATWVWHVMQEPDYAAQVRIALPAGALSGLQPAGTDGVSLRAPKDAVLSREVIAAAAALLHRRGIFPSVEASGETELNDLLNRLDARCEQQGLQDEIVLGYHAADAEQAIAVLTAVADVEVDWLRRSLPDPADPTMSERETEQSQLAQAIERQQAAEFRLIDRMSDLGGDEVENATNGEAIESLTAALNEARRDRLDAADWLTRARQQVRLGNTAEEIIAGLPDSPIWNSTRELLNRVRWQDELAAQEANLKSAAAILGRNHPRLVQLQSEVERQRRRLEEGAVRPRQTPPDRQSRSNPIENSPGTLVDQLVELLEARWQQTVTADEECEQKLAVATEKLADCKDVAAQLADIRQELAFLETEYERVRQEIASCLREADRRRPSLAGTPNLLPEPMSRPMLGPYLWAALGGLVVSGGLWMRIRRARPASVVSGENTVKSLNSNGFRSQQEDNLVRLRRLSIGS